MIDHSTLAWIHLCTQLLARKKYDKNIMVDFRTVSAETKTEIFNHLATLRAIVAGLTFEEPSEKSYTWVSWEGDSDNEYLNTCNLIADAKGVA